MAQLDISDSSIKAKRTGRDALSGKMVATMRETLLMGSSKVSESTTLLI